MSFNSIAERLDSVSPARSLRELFAQHYTVPPVNSLRDLILRHTHRQKARHRFMLFNTYLMDVLWGEGQKPAVEYRDAEIGKFTSDNYDIVCLNEVWHKEERNDLYAEWPDGTHMAHKSGVVRSRGRRRGRRIIKGIFSAGASEIGETNLAQMLNSAGLVNLSKTLPPVKTHFHEYKNESGTDAKAAKGCLLSVYETGYSGGTTPSSLCVYNTHLNAEGTAKYYQVLELADFIWRTKDKQGGDTSRPGRPGRNGVILAGDFNIDRHNDEPINIDDFLTGRLFSGYSISRRFPSMLLRAVRNRVDETGVVTDTSVSQKSGYQILSDLMAALGLQDLWVNRNNTSGYTSNFTAPATANVVARPDPANNFYCDDNTAPNAVERLANRPQAIDLVFVSATTRSMDFTMDFTRPRRPYTARAADAPDYDEFAWLSDHLGISTDILMAPKVDG